MEKTFTVRPNVYLKIKIGDTKELYKVRPKTFIIKVVEHKCNLCPSLITLRKKYCLECAEIVEREQNARQARKTHERNKRKI